MRIVQISGALAGAQKIIEEAIHVCALEQGHESCVLYACGTPSMEKEICYESRIENLLTRGLRKYVAKHPHFSLLQTLRLIWKIERFTPDVVHLHVLHHGYTDFPVLMKYLAKRKIPVVYTMHDMWAFTGGCYHYTGLSCTEYQSGCTNCPAKKSDLDVAKCLVAKSYAAKEKLLSRLEKLHIVTVSQWVKQELSGSFLAEYPISVIPNGVSADGIRKSEAAGSAQNDGKVHLLSVAASWTERKGIQLLLDLAETLGDHYEIWLVGSASEEVRKKAPKNIVFMGYCNDKSKLFDYYRDCDLYVSASQEETFGMTFVEAAYVGTRSVGYAGTAIGDTLKSVYGVAVEKYSAEAFADAIENILSQDCVKLTGEQVTEIQSRCSVEAMAQTYMDLYMKMTQAF